MTFECRRDPLLPTTPVSPTAKDQGIAHRTLRIDHGVSLQRAASHLGGTHLMSALADIEAGRASPETIPGFAGYLNWLRSLPPAPCTELPDWLRNNENPSPSTAVRKGTTHHVKLP